MRKLMMAAMLAATATVMPATANAAGLDGWQQQDEHKHDHEGGRPGGGQPRQQAQPPAQARPPQPPQVQQPQAQFQGRPQFQPGQRPDFRSGGGGREYGRPQYQGQPPVNMQRPQAEAPRGYEQRNQGYRGGDYARPVPNAAPQGQYRQEQGRPAYAPYQYRRNDYGRDDARRFQGGNPQGVYQRGYRQGYEQGNRGGFDRGWRSERQFDWQGYRSSHYNLFRLPRYSAPYGWSYGYRRFDIGVRLDEVLFAENYWIADPWYYRLPPVDPEFRWVRYYNDALLVDLESGEVVDVVYGIFY